jgi:hypothetical protein
VHGRNLESTKGKSGIPGGLPAIRKLLNRRHLDCAYFRLYFAYTVLVFNLPQSPLCAYAIRCKGCTETVAAPVGTMPGTSIVATCPLCGERRRYLLADIFRGKLSPRLGAAHV